MKNITVEVPRNGASIHLVLRAGASSGQAIIVASDNVEILVTEPVLPAEVQSVMRAPASKGELTVVNSEARDYDAILKRLTKLRPTKRAAAVNSIKAMFQFIEPIDNDHANEILDVLCRRGDLNIDPNGRVQFNNV